MDNRTIAERLLDMAHTLEKKQANLYRVQAYRRAAQSIMGFDRQIEDVVANEGRKGLAQLPGIGAKLSRKLETLVRTGEFEPLSETEKMVAAASERN